MQGYSRVGRMSAGGVGGQKGGGLDRPNRLLR